MTLPRAFALFNYWARWPPVHEVTRLAWLKMKDDKTPTADDGGNVSEFVSLEGVKDTWIGPPPFKMADVIELAEKAKERGKS